jgi:hypothetical protein
MIGMRMLAGSSSLYGKVSLTRSHSALQHLAVRSMPQSAGAMRRRSHVQPAQAQRQTIETPTAPGSNSNFTGLPEDPADIPVVGDVSGKQMQVS